MQRARGRAHVGVVRKGPRLGLSDLHQSGCTKVMIPNTYDPVPEAVFLNTAGGVTGGDDLRYSAELGPDAALRLTTQTAERGYASTGPAGTISVDLTVGPGAQLAWLPQETILFNKAHLRRDTRIDLLGNARCLAMEIVVLGRAAMGEVPADFALHDRRQITRNGQPVVLDPVTFDDASARAAAGLRGARAFVTLCYVGDGAEELPKPAQTGLAASAWDGRLIVRGAFADLWPLKQALLPYLTTLMTATNAGPLPRVWQM